MKHLIHLMDILYFNTSKYDPFYYIIGKKYRKMSDDLPRITTDYCEKCDSMYILKYKCNMKNMILINFDVILHFGCKITG